jgi:hypothetical protein
MRHIREIENLPISELSDEEIAKAAMYRLKAKFAALVYMDEEGHSFFICRYKNSAGRQFWSMLIKAWEGKFGKMHRIDDKDE